MRKQTFLVNDMAGYGKVALSAMIPVLSHFLLMQSAQDLLCQKGNHLLYMNTAKNSKNHKGIPIEQFLEEINNEKT